MGAGTESRLGWPNRSVNPSTRALLGRWECMNDVNDDDDDADDSDDDDDCQGERGKSQ